MKPAATVEPYLYRVVCLMSLSPLALSSDSSVAIQGDAGSQLNETHQPVTCLLYEPEATSRLQV